MVNVEELIGQTVDDKYDILEEIGRGAMGIVYRAKLRALQKDVAFKVLHKRYSHDEKYVKRFQAEAKISSSLGQNPNVAYVYGAGKVGNLNYIVMEYLPGGDLFDKLHGKSRPDMSESFDLFFEACQGLAFIHKNGIIHRDLKPANLMFSVDGHLNITDFGIATGEGTSEEDQGSAGTPKYMAPEQIKGDQVDARSDVYSMGIMLYEMLTHDIPFPANNVKDLLMKVLTQKPVPPRSVNSSIPEALEPVMLKAISRKKLDRYQSVAEFARAVAAAIGREAPDLPDTARQSLAAGFSWIHYALMAAAAIILIVGIVVLFTPKKPAPGSTDGGETPDTGSSQVIQPGETKEEFNTRKMREAEQTVRDYIKNGKLADATGHLIYALETYDEKDFSCRLLLGECLEKRGQIQDALKEYEKLIKYYPEDYEVLERIGKGYAQIEFYIPSIKFFEKLLEAQPDNVQANLELGLVYMKWASEDELAGEKESILVERYTQGLVFLNKGAGDLTPEQRPDVFLYMAQSYVRLGKFETARELLGQLPPEKQLSHKMYYLLGADSLEKKQYRQAVEELRKSIKKEGTPEEHFRALGLALVEGRKSTPEDTFFQAPEILDETIDALKKAGESEDNVIPTSLGWALYQKVKISGEGVDEAVTHLEKLKEQIPEDQDIQRMLTDLYQQSGSIDKLIDDLKSRVGSGGKDSETAQRLARTIVEKARHAQDVMEKERLLLEALGFSRNAEAVDMLVEIYLTRAGTTEGLVPKIKLYEKALELKESDKVRSMIAEVFIKAGLSATVLADKYRYYTKALKYDPTSKTAKHNLWTVYWKYYVGSKSADEKIGWLKEIKKIKPGDAKAIIYLIKHLKEKADSVEDELERQLIIKELKALEILINSR